VGRGSYGDGLRPTWFGVGSVPTEAAPLHYAATVGFRTGTAYGRPMSRHGGVSRISRISRIGEGGEGGQAKARLMAQCVVGQINVSPGRRTHGPCVPTAYEDVR
jgi:hypothetical protein